MGTTWVRRGYDVKRVEQRIERARYALQVLEDGLRGRPRRLGSTDAESVTRLLAVAGVESVTQTGARRRGYRLKRGARPLAER